MNFNNTGTVTEFTETPNQAYFYPNFLFCTVVRVHPFELLGSTERKWGVAGVWKIYPVELQDRARLHFPYTSSTYYHVEKLGR